MSLSVIPSSLVQQFSGANVATISDVLDSEYGLQGVMSHGITPLGRHRIVGRAVTALWVPRPDRAGGYGADQFFSTVDSCGPGLVFVVTNGGDRDVSCMGDLVATALQVRVAVLALAEKGQDLDGRRCA